MLTEKYNKQLTDIKQSILNDIETLVKDNGGEVIFEDTNENIPMVENNFANKVFFDNNSPVVEVYNNFNNVYYSTYVASLTVCEMLHVLQCVELKTKNDESK